VLRRRPNNSLLASEWYDTAYRMDRRGGREDMTEAMNDRDECPNCGGTDFDRGWVHAPGHAKEILYSPRDESSWWGFRGHRIVARRCLACGHLDLFARD